MKTCFPDPFNTQYDAFLKHLRLKGLRPKTIDLYSRGVRRIGDYFDYHVEALSEEQLLAYFSDLLDTRSWSALKHDLYGLKFFYQHVLHKPWTDLNLVKPPKFQRLPDILTQAEMQRLLAGTRILSYRVFFFTLYSLGLRLGEGLRLTVADMDAAHGRVHIRNAKGNKDRLVPLPDATLSLLRRFWRLHRHPTLLFPNRKRGVQAAHLAASPLDRGGVQVALRRAAADCGIKKRSRPIACATAMPPI
jgi:site-specific recombinase XerD